MDKWVRAERVGRVLVGTLSRAPVNAINHELIEELDQLVDLAIEDDEIAVVHLRSDQRVFSAGADLALINDCFATPEGPDHMVEIVHSMQRLYWRLEAAPVVTLAEIQTMALGGGLELALACDLRIAALDARVGLTEARLGLLPGAGGTQRLTRLCGPGVASRMILGAEIVSGAQAEQLGIVQWAVPREQLEEKARKVAAHYASMPKAALTANKRCIAAVDHPDHDGFAVEIEETRALYDNAETRRRVAEFLGRHHGSAKT